MMEMVQKGMMRVGRWVCEWVFLFFLCFGYCCCLLLRGLFLCFFYSHWGFVFLWLCVFFFAIEHMSFVSGLAFVYPFFVAAVLSLVRDTYLLFLLLFFFSFFFFFCRFLRLLSL
jgi:hypothetical protein